MEIALGVVQVLTFAAIVVYVWKTWHMASATAQAAHASKQMVAEMKEARAEEFAPYVVVYSELDFGTQWIYLVVRNVGKRVATNVRFQFEPELRNSRGGDIAKISLIRDGVRCLAPGQEIRTFFDSGLSYFNEEGPPLAYAVEVTYGGGFQEAETRLQQTLDLSAYKGVTWIDQKGIHELTKATEELAKEARKTSKELQRIRERLARGVWVQNLAYGPGYVPAERAPWRRATVAKLTQFQALWSGLYGGERQKMVGGFVADLRAKINLIADDLVVLAAACPATVEAEIPNSLVSVAARLSDLAGHEFFLDGGRSLDEFNARGDEILSAIGEVLAAIRSDHGPAF